MCKTSWSFGHVLRHMVVGALRRLHADEADVDLLCYSLDDIAGQFVPQDDVI